MAQTKKKPASTKKAVVKTARPKVAKKVASPAPAAVPVYTERVVAMAAAFTALCVAFAIFAIAQSNH